MPSGGQNKLNLTKQKFDKLFVIEEAGSNKNRRSLWLCKCDCGNIIVVKGYALKNGHTRSCGCLNHRKGKDSPNWKLNLTDEDRQDRRLIPGYKEWVQAVFKRDNYTCQICGQVGGKLNAHHLESYNSNPKLRTKLSNGATTCDKCHNNFHHQYGKGNNTKKQFKEFKRRQHVKQGK